MTLNKNYPTCLLTNIGDLRIFTTSNNQNVSLPQYKPAMLTSPKFRITKSDDKASITSILFSNDSDFV